MKQRLRRAFMPLVYIVPISGYGLLYHAMVTTTHPAFIVLTGFATAVFALYLDTATHALRLDMERTRAMVRERMGVQP